MTDFGSRAFRHVCFLAQKIGPRPAGSPAEKQAFDYIAGQLEAWGYNVERQTIRFAPPQRFFPLFALGGLMVVIASWAVGGFPWLTLWLPLLIPALPQVARWLVRRRPRTTASENIFAQTESPMLIICAHVDSARAGFFQERRWLWLQSKTMFAISRVGIAIALFSLLSLFGIELPAVNVALGLVGTLAGGWWLTIEVLNQLGDQWSPGAHDNASGVAVALTLAEHFAANPPVNLRLGFLFTGAEETGMHGAEAFVEQMRPGRFPKNLPGLLVLNLDMVGAGSEVRFVTGEGTLAPLRTDARLNALIQKAHPAARGVWYSVRSGDFAAFLRRGLPAASLQTSGSEKANLAYHTLNDTIEVIEQTALQMAAEVVVKIVGLMDG